MALEIAGKTALVTGGASGICREFVKKLVAGGCNVTIADLNPGPEDNGAGETAQTSQSPGQTMFVQTDVTNWDELQNAFDKTIERFGRLDIVCPGAGVFEPVRQATFLSILRWNELLTAAAILKLLALQQRNRHKRIIQLQDT